MGDFMEKGVGTMVPSSSLLPHISNSWHLFWLPFQIGGTSEYRIGVAGLFYFDEAAAGSEVELRGSTWADYEKTSLSSHGIRIQNRGLK